MRALKAILALLMRRAPALEQPCPRADPRAEIMRKRRIERALKSEGLTRSAARRVLRAVMEEYRDAGR